MTACQHIIKTDDTSTARTQAAPVPQRSRSCEADPASLADPADVARRITDMIDDPARASSGSRLSASNWELQ